MRFLWQSVSRSPDPPLPGGHPIVCRLDHLVSLPMSKVHKKVTGLPIPRSGFWVTLASICTTCLLVHSFCYDMFCLVRKEGRNGGLQPTAQAIPTWDLPIAVTWVKEADLTSVEPWMIATSANPSTAALWRHRAQVSPLSCIKVPDLQ